MAKRKIKRPNQKVEMIAHDNESAPRERTAEELLPKREAINNDPVTLTNDEIFNFSLGTLERLGKAYILEQRRISTIPITAPAMQRLMKGFVIFIEQLKQDIKDDESEKSEGDKKKS